MKVMRDATPQRNAFARATISASPEISVAMSLNDELALWTRIKHIWCDEQLKPAEAATSSEVTDRSTRCALLHECGECCGRITR